MSNKEHAPALKKAMEIKLDQIALSIRQYWTCRVETIEFDLIDPEEDFKQI